MGELESAVMDVVWDRGGWLTPGEVHEVLAAERPLAYTTVMTILVRLWQKGRLRRQRDRRAYPPSSLLARPASSAPPARGSLRPPPRPPPPPPPLPHPPPPPH